jgi:predicted DNA-binding protein (UPF0251 family)/predicted Fe-Mo cluster-binding NifX family protein
MVRPVHNRRVAFIPDVTYFKPAGIPARQLAEVTLKVEELEAVRICDLEGLEQDGGARSMGVSRPTFQRVLYAGRRKIADALLNGKAIRIEGGTFRVNSERAPETNGTAFSAKIAIPTEDGVTISLHFGKAPRFVVITVREGVVTGREERPKAHHGLGGLAMKGDVKFHDALVEPILDCDIVLTGGIGWNAYESLRVRGLRPVLTEVQDIDEAVLRLVSGTLSDRVERVHGGGAENPALPR